MAEAGFGTESATAQNTERVLGRHEEARRLQGVFLCQPEFTLKQTILGLCEADRPSSAYRITPLATEHIPDVVRLLKLAFPDSLLTALGAGFLEELFASYIHISGGCAFVSMYGREVVAFIAGSDDARAHRLRFIRRRWPFLMFHILKELLLSPPRLVALARYLRPYLTLRRGRESESWQEDPEGIPPASLVLLGVSPQHRRQGNAERLARAFLQEMANRFVDRVKLAVADHNEAALAFYLSRGWQIAGRYQGPEGAMVFRLVYTITPRMIRNQLAA
ncbi:MAG: GNAT family N-acetyltransferase [Chloroflexota bacterium]